MRPIRRLSAFSHSRPSGKSPSILAAAALCLGGTAMAGPFEKGPEMLEPSPFLLWDSTWTLRAGGGYRDNPTIAHTFREPSGFANLGIDWMLLRPPTDNNQFYLFFSGDDRRYVNAPDIPFEETFITSAQWTHTTPDGWAGGVGLIHFYADQVFDLSNENNGFGTARARGHTLILKPLLRREIDSWAVELEPALSLQYFGQPLDDSREVAPKLKLTRSYGYKSSVELSLNAGRRFYETTRLLAADGTPISGTHEQLTTRGAEVQWRHWWGAGHHWRTTLRALASRSDDNGSGYFDHDKWGAYAQLRYVQGRWTAELTARVARYDYPMQPDGSATGAHRQRDELTAELKVEYQWTKHLKSVVSAERQRSAANTSFDDFSVTTVQGWLEWEY